MSLPSEFCAFSTVLPIHHITLPMPQLMVFLQACQQGHGDVVDVLLRCEVSWIFFAAVERF